MNIVWILPGGVDRSGRERVVPAYLWLLEELAAQHDVLVIALNQYATYQTYQLLGAEVINLGQVAGRINEFKLPRRLFQIWNALRGRRIDVIHAFNLGECGLLAGIVGKILRVPVMASVNNGEMIWLPDIHYGWQGRMTTRLAVRLSCAAARIVTAGSHDALEPVNHPQPAMLPFGVKTDVFKTIPRPEMTPPFRLLHVANINPVKDQVTLLHAIRRVASQVPVTLDWFGIDTMNGTLQRLTAELGLQDVVRYHGARPIDELVPYYQQAHVLVHSSRFESQGMVVAEAAMVGLPVVGTNVGLLADLAPEAAAAVPVQDHERLAEVIVDLLADRERLIAMGEAARAWAAAHDAAWCATEHVKLYRSML